MELGFNSDKSRYFYLGELRLQFIGKSQGIEISWRAVVQKRLLGSTNINKSRGMSETEASERRMGRLNPQG